MGGARGLDDGRLGARTHGSTSPTRSIARSTRCVRTASQTSHMEDLADFLRGWAVAQAEAGGLAKGRLAEGFQIIQTGEAPEGWHTSGMTILSDRPVDEIKLSDPELWQQPDEVRDAVFAKLRAESPISFQPEPEYEAPSRAGPGILGTDPPRRHLGREPQPRAVLSQVGGSNIGDMPIEIAEFFGSMISHGRARGTPGLRMIVQKAFTPKVVAAIEEDVRRKAKAIVDEHAEKGEGDFVQLFASPLPLQIICEMMGVERDEWNTVFEATNTILGVGDPEYVSDMGQLMAAAMSLYQMAIDLGEERLANPTRRPHHRAHACRGRRRATDDARARLVLHPARRRRQRDDPQLDQPRHEAADRPPRSARALARRLQRPRSRTPSRRSCATRRRSSTSAARRPRHRAQRREDRRGREGRALVHVGQPRRGASSPIRTRSTSLARTSRTRWASARAARTTASAPTWPAAR